MLLRAGRLALAVVRARPEVLVHRLDHRLGAAEALGLALREQVEVGELGAGEQVGGAVRAGRHARAAADALGGVHRRVGDRLRDRDQVGVGRTAGLGGDEAARLDDAVERRAVDHQVLDDRERAGPPRLDRDRRRRSRNLRMCSWHVAVPRCGPWAWPSIISEHVPQMPSRQSWSNTIASLPSAISRSLRMSSISRNDASSLISSTV